MTELKGGLCGAATDLPGDRGPRACSGQGGGALAAGAAGALGIPEVGSAAARPCPPGGQVSVLVGPTGLQGAGRGAWAGE